ncbi:MAG: hypothetical protein K8R21_09540 [Leptospira sp.]|nr:hypothetical protein [Leptospira sp.]
MIEFIIKNNAININFRKKELGFDDSREMSSINSQIPSLTEYREIVVTFDTVRLISSTFMGQLARFVQIAKANNMEVSVKGFIDPFVFQLLSISGLESYLKFPDRKIEDSK